MNTIRELKQQEKYKNMLKRKNKEKNIYKTQNETLRIKYEGIKKLLEKKDKEIEKPKNIINELEKWLKEQMQDTDIESFIIYKSVLEKLQELKGDGSNDSKGDV